MKAAPGFNAPLPVSALRRTRRRAELVLRVVSYSLAESAAAPESVSVDVSACSPESTAELESAAAPESVAPPSDDFDASPAPESAAGGAGGFVSSPVQARRVEPAAKVATAKRAARKEEEDGERVRMAGYAPARNDVAFVLRTREN